MRSKLAYLFLLICGAMATYEAYAVVIAYNTLPHKFAPYASVTPMDLGLNIKRQEILVKVQDPSFFKHTGIDCKRLQKNRANTDCSVCCKSKHIEGNPICSLYLYRIFWRK
ncbi:MAG: hypothetical protein P8163_22685 [Candidatus Thiodiazotropha sp.]